jgi:Fe-S oxidoreductase
MLKKWDSLSPCEEMLYPGCNIITSPYLTRTSLLADLEIRGSLETCCGEMYYRMGLFDQVEQVARRLEGYFRKLGVKRLVVPCTAGYNMFTNVLPRFGFKPEFEIQHLLVRLWERIEDGRIEIKHKLRMKATIQDSCYGKLFSAEILELPRKLLERLGVEVVEERYSRQNSLCCGIAAGFGSYSAASITSATIRSLKEARATGADAVVVYCAGCLQMLSTGRAVYPTRMPVYHILEMLQMAIGEKPARLQGQRGRAFLLGTLRHELPTRIISGKRFRIREIAPEW